MKRDIQLDTKWISFSLNNKGVTKDIPIILIECGPKNIAEIKNKLKNFDTCIVLFLEQNIFFLKSPNESFTTTLENEYEYKRVTAILHTCDIANSKTELQMQIRIAKAIDKIPNATKDFDNRGIFSTHYLRKKIFEDVHRNIDSDIDNLKSYLTKNPVEILNALGWNISHSGNLHRKENTSIIITNQEDFGIRKENNVAPNYTAIASLRKSQWVILTNGKKWRLYTSKISATSTNYFEITLDPSNHSILKYLIVIFGYASFEEKDGKSDILTFFSESKNYATELEEDLSSKIIKADGLFLDIVKGVLDHDMKKIFTIDDLENAKQISLKIMYRIWFLTYAESRDLLPVKDPKYRPISIQSIRSRLDSYEKDPNGIDCWTNLLKLFECIRDGSVEHNLPQYDGELFKNTASIDDVNVKNRFITSALHGLLEKNGESIDYANLSVRHLGNIFETLMEFGIRQAKNDIMLVEDGDDIHEVKTKQESTYSYKENELYLAAKGGIAMRKTSASFYTPDKMVQFLVKQGLGSTLKERDSLIKQDIQTYQDDSTDENYNICVDRLLDIQVLDPAMGSGHFLVEALNQITQWVTEILNIHSTHPLLKQIEDERKIIINEQMKKGITIDENFLTNDVLLKRKIMKRCIFGVDINPMAVELTKLSLWLDSFAIGVPLTYMNHHIKVGDSTIGMWLSDRKENVTDQTLDEWFDAYHTDQILHNVSVPADITIAELQKTKQNHEKYETSIKPHKTVLDVLTAKFIDDTIAKDTPKDLSLIFEIEKGRNIVDEHEKYKSVITNASKLTKKFKFFHWELEMNDAFTDTRRGFDLIITNPPWDKVRPNKNEFFTRYNSEYKKISDKEKKEIHKKYSTEYDEYKQTLNEKRTFYKNRGGIGDNTDFEMYRLILERILQLLTPNGVCSILIPSAIINSRGATALRSHILDHKIISLYGFENKKRIFPIHPQTKFVLLTMQNIRSATEFPTTFYLHDPNELDTIDVKSFMLTKTIIQLLSSNIMIICEMKNRKDLNIFIRLFKLHPRLEDMDGWSVDLGRELNLGEQNDKELLVKDKHVQNSWPVLESKNFHQHIWDFVNTEYYADTRKTLKKIDTKRKFYGLNKEIHENPRLVYRSISSSTNTRTMITSVLPPSLFTTIGAYMVIPHVGTLKIDDNYHKLNVYLCGVFNSMTFDYLIRPKIDKNVETYHINDTIVPKDFTNKIAVQIIRLTALLFLGNIWHEDMANSLEILKEDVSEITLQMYIDIVSKIDALVAIHYGLTRDEYIYVMNSFKFNKGSIPTDMLEQKISLSDYKNGDRNKIMKQLFHDTRISALSYYDEFIKESS